jgi:Xaa-Pro aminopeptidase
MWADKQIIEHRLACEILNRIKDETFNFIRERKAEKISEYKIQQFILKRFKKYNLKNEVDKPIVAFNENASNPHYFPKKSSKKLKNNTLILIDIWARLNRENAPYADITWVAYYGKISEEVKRVFDIVIKARNLSLDFIREKLRKKRIPTGREVDDIAVEVITRNGYEKNIKHRTGHSIGLKSPHGEEKHVNCTNIDSLKENLAYTIEPGIYLDKKFGVRSEICFLMRKNRLIVTTPVQKKLILI